MAEIYDLTLPPELQKGPWQLLEKGLSGAGVFKGVFVERDCYLKITPHAHRMAVKAEYERLKWLQGRIPVPEILAYVEDEARQYLVTATVDGIDAFEFDAKPDDIIRLYAKAIRRLHDLPTADCPFTWIPDEQIAFAQKSVQNNQVNDDNRDEAFKERSWESMLEELIRLRPNDADLVMVHGDAYNDNVLLNPSSGELAAFIDVGFVAVADRCTDLAMIYDDVVDYYGIEGWQAFLKHYGSTDVEPQRFRFYQLFNEFI
ncbi:MAG: aminoglycoside 3'-phosphotransferase [Anaerolineae bacterium]|nr:aminoglycoside 3'-phosphotransferase [Anaerolineae bacterium]